MTKPAQTCSHDQCSLLAVGQGLCATHYRRKRASLPLDDPLPALGSEDGHGRYGIVDEDHQGLLCHECGLRFGHLSNHVVRTHQMSAREYKLTHGLPLSQGLVATPIRAAMVQRGRAWTSSSGWATLERKRDPVAANAALRQDAQALHSPARTRAATTHARALTQDQRGQPAPCTTCGEMIPKITGRKRRKLCDACLKEDLRQRRARTAAAQAAKNKDRDERIVSLRMQGLRLKDIAALVGLSASGVAGVLARAQTATDPDRP